MTGPGSADASRMRIAGIVLLAIAGVAAVVGLLALGGEGPSTAPTAAPVPTNPGAPLPGAGGVSPAPAPGQPGQPGPGQPGQPVGPGASGAPGGAPAGGTPVGGAPGGAPGGGAPVAGAPIVVPDGGGGPGAGGGSGGGSGGSGGSGGGSSTTAVPVRVFNNSTITGLADRAASQMRARGWNVVQVGNYPSGIIPVSTAYYRPGTDEQAAAESAARQFGIRSEPRFEGIRDASPGLIVIATNNWGQNAS